ncbi:MAG: thiaminase II [Paracoccaceae bacterium]
MTPDYGKTFALWRKAAAGPWHDYTHHAFVEGLENGTLPRSAFLHYLIQDYVFLVHFSRAWSLAVVKSETLEEMKICARTVDALVNHEMSLHVKTCAAEGINEDTLFAATEAVESLAYTRYVMDAGIQGDFLDLMATLAPCVMGYGEIGLRLQGGKADDSPYAEWIATYAAPEYQAVCTNVGAMIDNAVARRISDLSHAPRAAVLQERFCIATKLEVGFWQMGLNGA